MTLQGKAAHVTAAARGTRFEKRRPPVSPHPRTTVEQSRFPCFARKIPCSVCLFPSAGGKEVQRVRGVAREPQGAGLSLEHVESLQTGAPLTHLDFCSPVGGLARTSSEATNAATFSPAATRNGSWPRLLCCPIPRSAPAWDTHKGGVCGRAMACPSGPFR